MLVLLGSTKEVKLLGKSSFIVARAMHSNKSYLLVRYVRHVDHRQVAVYRSSGRFTMLDRGCEQSSECSKDICLSLNDIVWPAVQSMTS